MYHRRADDVIGLKGPQLARSLVAHAFGRGHAGRRAGEIAGRAQNEHAVAVDQSGLRHDVHRAGERLALHVRHGEHAFAAGPYFHPVARPLRTLFAVPIARRTQRLAHQHEGRALGVRITLPRRALFLH